MHIGVLSVSCVGITILLILIFASITDIRTRTVSNKVCFLIAMCSLSCLSLEKLFGFVFAIIILIIAAITDEMGGGDVKIIAALSLFLGMEGMLVMLFFAALPMLIFYVVIRLVKGRKTNKWLPFIPFITLGYLSNLILIAI